MSLVIDKQTRDLIERTNKQADDIKRLQEDINRLLNKSVAIVTTGSLGTEPSNSHATLEGVIGNGPIHLSKDEKSHLDFFNGTFLEKITGAITEAGGVVTLTIGQVGGGDLTVRFVSRFSIIPDNSTIALTVGTDSSPQANYIYVLESAPTTLVKSDASWPAANVDHCKIAFLHCQSAASVQTSGGTLGFQLWNDEADDVDFQGHLSHITEKLRRLNATWFDGVAGNGTSNYLTLGAGTSDFKSTAGNVYQLHKQVFAAMDTSTGSELHVKNWSGDAFHVISDLYDIVADNGGVTIGNNKYFNLVFWGVANKSGEHQTVMINLPSGFYNTEAAAQVDIDGLDDFTIPREYSIDSSLGFLIARVTLQMKTGGGTWVHSLTTDLRGTTPQTATGGAGSSRYTDAEAQLVINATTHDLFTTPDATDINHLTDAQITALHAIYVLTQAKVEAVVGVHTIKYTDAEADTRAALQDHDHATPIATHAAITSSHHTKYLDSEAVDAVEAVSFGTAVALDSMSFVTQGGILRRQVLISLDETVLVAMKTYIDGQTHEANTDIAWNASTVSQAEAEAGTATTDRKWTAERVKQAIAALGGGDADADLMIGSGNAEYVPCAFVDLRASLDIPTHGAWIATDGLGNKGSTWFWSLWSLIGMPLTRGGLDLYVAGSQVTIKTANGSNFITQRTVVGTNAAGFATLNNNTGNLTSSLIHNAAFTGVKVGTSYSGFIFELLHTNVTLNNLVIAGVALKVYYA